MEGRCVSGESRDAIVAGPSGQLLPHFEVRNLGGISIVGAWMHACMARSLKAVVRVSRKKQ